MQRGVQPGSLKSEVSLKNFNDFIFISTLEGWEEWDGIGSTKIPGVPEFKKTGGDCDEDAIQINILSPS